MNSSQPGSFIAFLGEDGLMGEGDLPSPEAHQLRSPRNHEDPTNSPLRKTGMVVTDGVLWELQRYLTSRTKWSSLKKM